MPFTNAWSVVIPAGGVAAKLIDDHIRQLRLDLQERFNATLFVDFATDPLVLLDAVKGVKTSKILMLPFSLFNSNTTGKDTLYTAHKLTAFTDTGPLVCAIPLPAGVHLRRVEVMVEKVDAGNLQVDLRRRAFANGDASDGSVVVVGLNSATAGVQIMQLPDVDILIDQTGLLMYYIVVEANGTAGNSFNLFGARITYDAPDGLSTY